MQTATKSSPIDPSYFITAAAVELANNWVRDNYPEWIDFKIERDEVEVDFLAAEGGAAYVVCFPAYFQAREVKPEDELFSAETHSRWIEVAISGQVNIGLRYGSSRKDPSIWFDGGIRKEFKG